MVDRFRGSFRLPDGETWQTMVERRNQAHRIREENEHGQSEPGVIRDEAGRVVQIKGVNNVPFGSQPDVVLSRRGFSVLEQYDQVKGGLKTKLVNWRLRRPFESMGLGEIALLDVQGDRFFQEVQDASGLKSLPIILARWPGRQVLSNIVRANVLVNEREINLAYKLKEKIRSEIICINLEKPLKVGYRKLYLPKPHSWANGSRVSMVDYDFLPNVEVQLKDPRIHLGAIDPLPLSDEMAKEGVMLIAEGEGRILYLGNLRLLPGWGKFFRKNGHMFTASEITSLEPILEGRKQVLQAETAEDSARLATLLEFDPWLAIDKIKGEVAQYPDPAHLDLQPGEKAAAFGHHGTARIMTAKDRVLVALPNLNVASLARLANQTGPILDQLDEVFSPSRDYLALQMRCTSDRETEFRAAVVRRQETQRRYVDSLSAHRDIIEASQRSHPGFSEAVFKQIISDELGNPAAFVAIVSQLTPVY